jgi:hypothetical protein
LHKSFRETKNQIIPMKKLLFLSALIAGSLSFGTAKAQIGVHLNVNLGARPVYVAPAPVVVDDYYYLPDADAYYSVPEQVYYYQYGGRWVSGPRLVGRYRDYDYNRLRHYSVNEARPYLRNDYYRARYSNPQFAGRYNGGYRDVNYGRSAYRNDDRGRFDNRNQHFDRGNYGGGRNDHHDNGNHNGWYRR